MYAWFGMLQLCAARSVVASMVGCAGDSEVAVSVQGTQVTCSPTRQACTALICTVSETAKKSCCAALLGTACCTASYIVLPLTLYCHSPQVQQCPGTLTHRDQRQWLLPPCVQVVAAAAAVAVAAELLPMPVLVQ